MEQNNKLNNKRKEIASGLVWTYAERIMAQGVSLLVTIVLARIIMPEDFGAITIVTVFINIANTLATDGFGTALIQKKKADIEDFSSVFYFSLGFSVIVYALIFVFAPYLAAFYEMPILTPVIRVMSVRIILAGINSVQQAYISRKMQFKKFFVSTSFGTCISALIGIGMAYQGYGIWALAIQYITNATIDTVILFFTSGLQIKPVFSIKRLRGLIGYGWKLVASSLMISLYSNIRDLIVGKKYSSADLAFYNKGNQFPSFISSNINTSISKVLFPALSAFQDDRISLKRMTRRSISVGGYLLFPILLGLATVADSFVRLVLTEAWIPCVPYLQIYCLIFMLQPLQTASLQAMKAIGKSELYLKLEIVKKIVGVIILCISIFAFDSMLCIAIGAVVVELFSTVVNIPVNKRLLNYQYREQFSDIFPSAILSVVMCVIVYLCGVTIDGVVIKILVQIGVGVVVYIIMSSLFRMKEFEYISDIVFTFFRRTKGKRNE